MTARQILKRTVRHLIAWLLLLGLGIAAILGGIALVGHGYWSTFIVRPSDAGGTANVVLFLAALAIGVGAYIARGVTSAT